MSDLGHASNWSQTAASNNAAAPNGAPEGMAPSVVNDTIREVMAALRRWRDQVNPTITTGGTANAQTATMTTAEAAYYTGQVYSALIGASLTSTTTTPTINFGAMGAKTVKQPDGSALSYAGMLLAGAHQFFAYDGTDLRMMNLPWKTGTFTPALSGGGGSATYTSQTGRYIRIGPKVEFWARIVINTTTLSGAVNLTGLPYAAAEDSYGQQCVSPGFGYNAYATPAADLQCSISSGATTVLIQAIQQNGTTSVLSTGLGAGVVIEVSGFYFTAAAL